MEKILAILGILIVTGLVYGMSQDKKNINWKTVLTALLVQIGFAGIMILTPAWKVVEWLSNLVSNILGYANEGIVFVFGDLATSGFSLFLSSLMPVVFTSALVGLLFHFGILQKIIKVIGILLAKLFNVDTIVMVNSIANSFLGQSDSLFVTKNYLPKVKDSVIFATLVGGMTSISVGVIGLYVGFGASLEWIIISMPLTVLGSFTFTQIIFPTRYEDVDKLEIEATTGSNCLETMVNYGRDGFNGVIGVTIALLVFISLVALVNGILPFGLTLEGILGIVFRPLAFLMGVPLNEVNMVAEILATKLVLNEAVAFGLPTFAMLSVKAKAMMTVALCGFAGFASIGILIGTYTAIAPEKVKVVAKYGMLALLTATLVNILSGTIVGLFL